jgi:hypothetical protein
MNSSGLVLIIFGVWVITQVLKGEALRRLGIPRQLVARTRRRQSGATPILDTAPWKSVTAQRAVQTGSV